MPPKIILTTVPTGLGHIRVTKALAKGIPTELTPIIFGITDETTAFLYRIISTHWVLRKILEFTQTNQVVEKLTTQILNAIQTSDTKSTEILLQGYLKENQEQQVIIVSTHAFIAQKIQRILNAKKLTNPITHAVVITDDSPQRFWMVNADVVFAPSEYTRDTLLALYAKDKRTPPPIEVNPYPINPNFCTKLRPEILYNKIEQLNPKNPQKARICIPVSGAAVQLDYYEKIIKELTCEETKSQCREFAFSVVTREGNYTMPFIEKLRNTKEVSFHIGANDEQTVELYDQLYEQLNPPSLEITKPSEQCFKVLTTPDTLGGSILLLTEPVGRQEYDNLNFLERHGFLPSESVQEELDEALISKDANKLSNFLTLAQNWRCLRLSHDPYHAAIFITNCLTQGIFMSMQKYKEYQHTNELSPNGVSKIWESLNIISKPL